MTLWGDGYFNLFALVVLQYIFIYIYVLSHFSHVQLFVTPWTVVCQAPLSTGILQANTGMGCHSSSHGSAQARDWTCISCIGRQILYLWAPWEAYIYIYIYVYVYIYIYIIYIYIYRYRYVITRLYTLKLHNVICQPCLDKSEGKNKMIRYCLIPVGMLNYQKDKR